MNKIFIDGRAGTTGLRIAERLAPRDDIELISLPDELRKSPEARRDALNRADIAFLCLPDDAAREAVSMIENNNVTVIDASTAHRTLSGWAYGFPELDECAKENIRNGKRIAVPGCHASGFIALIYPLIKEGVLSPSSLLCATSLTGYSGGGNKMIAEYTSDERSPLLDAPRQYGIGQMHKHLPEMKKICGLEKEPLFCPIVGDFYSGMEVTVPISGAEARGGIKRIKQIYSELYRSPVVRYVDSSDESGFLSAARLSGKDSMWIEVHGNEDRILLVARYDNLGKGASGAAIECMNIKLGCDITRGLVI